MEPDDMSQLFEKPLTDEAVIAIIANEVPRMTVAQLAELLTNLFLAGPGAVSDAIAPLARAELSRRRFIDYVEYIAAGG